MGFCLLYKVYAKFSTISELNDTSLLERGSVVLNHSTVLSIQNIE